MQTKFNSAFLLCLFFLNTILCADDIKDYRRNQFEKDFPTMQCSKTATSPYEGHYVTKEYWTKLEQTKSHPLSGGSLSIDIGKDGYVNVGLHYHEGGSYFCSFVKDNSLWSCASDHECISFKIDNNQQLISSHHDRPLIRVGKAGDYTVYFEKIFQHKCYTSDVGEKWCFGKEEITIDQKTRKAYLMLDLMERPEYGNTLTFDNEYGDEFFVFVPYKNGWKIFQDTWLSIENHVEVNPLTDKPWRILQ